MPTRWKYSWKKTNTGIHTKINSRIKRRTASKLPKIILIWWCFFRRFAILNHNEELGKYMAKPKLTAIVGSLRKDSFNRQLAYAAKEIVGSRADFELLDYNGVPFMNQDIEFPAPEAVRRVRDAVKTSDGIWFFTPEYNHFFPGVLKNLLDWLSRPSSKDEAQVLYGKAAAISGITPGAFGTALAQDHLTTLISFLNMRVMNSPRLTIANAMQQTDANGRLALGASAPYLKN
jgi:chromate reductase